MEVEGLLGRMTLEEKVGQLFLLAFESQDEAAAETLFERYFVGGSYLSNDNLPTPERAAAMTGRIQAIAKRTRLAIPVLLGADQEGAWSVMYPGSSPGPGNMALGATGDPERVREMYEVIGREARAVGLDVILSPCADVNADPENVGIGVRSFGERAGLVADMTAAAVRGALEAGSLPTLKHFPGHGATTLDSHRGLPRVDRERDELLERDLLPFARGIGAGAPLVMTAHILFPALDPSRPATLSPLILDDLLRGELGFEGVVMSDSMNMQSMRMNYDPVDATTQAINAGVDIVMLAEEHYDHDDAYLARQVALIEAIRQACHEGRISEQRLDQAVGRILALKARIDVDRPLDPGSVGGAMHRSVEVDAARRAMAHLRRSDGALPIAPGTRLTLVNTSLRSAYDILGATRGIGPNQTDAAFDLFAAAVRKRSPDVEVLSAEEVLEGRRPSQDAAIVAVTENHPLPGADFDQSAKGEVLRALLELGQRLTVVALRDPYELRDLPFVTDYLCAFGSRWCSAEAAAEVLFGEVEPRGASPVSVPGAAIEAR